jgi:hypothetical protein
MAAIIILEDPDWDIDIDAADHTETLAIQKGAVQFVVEKCRRPSYRMLHQNKKASPPTINSETYLPKCQTAGLRELTNFSHCKTLVTILTGATIHAKTRPPASILGTCIWHL